MVDFREIKDDIKNQVKQLSEEDKNWNWRAVVNKNSVKVYWGYLQYIDREDSHFTIQMNNDEKDFVVALNEHNEYMSGRIIGSEIFEDGSLKECCLSLLRSIAGIAHSRY